MNEMISALAVLFVFTALVQLYSFKPISPNDKKLEFLNKSYIATS